MGEAAKSLPPEMRIRKSPAELKALAKKHMHAMENGINWKVKDAALFDLTNLLLDNPGHINERTVGSLFRALMDKSETVSFMAEFALVSLVRDYPEETIPLLVAEEEKAEGMYSKKLSSAIKTIFSLPEFGERVILRDIRRKHRKVELPKVREKQKGKPQKKVAAR